MNNITILDSVSSSGFPDIGAKISKSITQVLKYLHIRECIQKKNCLLD
jgi:hypothetical protein